LFLLYFIGTENVILISGLLTPEFFIITVGHPMKDALPKQRALTMKLIRKGITLAPYNGIPYNPRALSQSKFIQNVFARDFFEFAEEAGSR
jgi:hypothetical protein